MVQNLPGIIPPYKIPQDIIPESEKRDKIPHNKIKLRSNKRTTFYHNNLFAFKQSPLIEIAI